MSSEFQPLAQDDGATTDPTPSVKITRAKLNCWKIISAILFSCVCLLIVYVLLIAFGVVSSPRTLVLSYASRRNKHVPINQSIHKPVPSVSETKTNNESTELVDKINRDARWKWKAVITEAFARSDVQVFASSRNYSAQRWREVNSLTLGPAHSSSFTPPVSFDLRNEYPRCSHLHQPTVNQGRCGSCWAVSATSMLSDRICIASNQTVDIQLSAIDVVTCSPNGFYNGRCSGAHPTVATNYIKENGVPTGGSYGSEEGCRPYEYDASCSSSPCTLHQWYTADSKACKKMCRKGYSKRYEDDKYHISKAYRLSNVRYEHSKEPTVKRVQNDLMKKGPVVACFQVYGDFLLYSSGIYEPTGLTSLLYGHCVRVIGWGVEGGIEYWLAANSFGRDWGEAGFFKIRRENAAAGFEYQMYAMDPKI